MRMRTKHVQTEHHDINKLSYLLFNTLMYNITCLFLLIINRLIVYFGCIFILFMYAWNI